MLWCSFSILSRCYYYFSLEGGGLKGIRLLLLHCKQRPSALSCQPFDDVLIMNYPLWTCILFMMPLEIYTRVDDYLDQ